MPLTPTAPSRRSPSGPVRLIDFALSNVINSRYLHVIVLTSTSPTASTGTCPRRGAMSAAAGQLRGRRPAQQRVGKHWYLGSADAIYQCLNIIEDERPDIVVVVGADTCTARTSPDGRRATSRPVRVHRRRDPPAIEEADQFGVIEVDPTDPTRIKAFWRSRPTRWVWPTPPARSWRRWATTSPTRTRSSPPSRPTRERGLAPRHGWRHRAVLRRARHCGRLDFLRNDVPGSTPRDRRLLARRRTIDAFYEANIDLISIEPVFNLYNDEWPLYSGYTSLAPAKFIHAGAGRLGHAVDSVVSPGVLVSGATVSGSVPVPRRAAALVGAVTDSVLFDDVHIGRYAQVHRAIIDKNVVVPGARCGSAWTNTTTTATAASPSRSPASPSSPRAPSSRSEHRDARSRARALPHVPVSTHEPNLVVMGRRLDVHHR